MARNVYRQPTIPRSALLGSGNYVFDLNARVSALGNYHLDPGIRDLMSAQKRINDQVRAVLGPAGGILATQRAQMEALGVAVRIPRHREHRFQRIVIADSTAS